MKHQFQFAIGDGLAGDTSIEGGHAEQGLAVEDGDGNLGSEQFKFFLDLHVVAGFASFAAKDAAFAEKMSADAAFEGELEVFEQAGGQPDGAGGAETTVVGDDRCSQVGGGLAQEDRGPVDSEDLAQEEEELA